MTKLTYNVIMLYNIDKKLSFKFFYFGWLFASQKKREMHSMSRPEFALQTRAIRGSAIAPAASLASLARAEYLFTDEC